MEERIIKITLQRCKLMAIITIINQRINNIGTRREQFLRYLTPILIDHNVVLYAIGETGSNQTAL